MSVELQPLEYQTMVEKAEYPQHASSGELGSFENSGKSDYLSSETKSSSSDTDSYQYKNDDCDLEMSKRNSAHQNAEEGAKKGFATAITMICFSYVADYIIMAGFLGIYPGICSHYYGFENVGTCVGVLNGMVNLGQAFSTVFVGYIADRWGRRAPILAGLAAGAVGTAFLVLSRSFVATCVVLFLVGVFDCISPITKAMVADVTTGPTRSLAFGIRSAAGGIGRTVWITLASICMSSNMRIVGSRFKFVGLVEFTCYIVCLLCCILWLPETHPVLAAKKAAKKYLRKSQLALSYGQMMEKGSNDSVEVSLRHSAPPQPANQGGQEAKARGGLVANYRMIDGVKFLLKDFTFDSIMALLFVNTCVNGGVQAVILLYLALSEDMGGLGVPTNVAAYGFSIYFGAGALSQICIFPYVSTRMTTKRCYILYESLGAAGSLLLLLCHGAERLVGVKIMDSFVLVAILVIALALHGSSLMANMPLLTTILTNRVDPSLQGLATGLSQIFVSFARSAAGGALWFGYIFGVLEGVKLVPMTWALLGALQIGCCIHTWMLGSEPQPTFLSYIEEQRSIRSRGTSLDSSELSNSEDAILYDDRL